MIPGRLQHDSRWPFREQWSNREAEDKGHGENREAGATAYAVGQMGKDKDFPIGIELAQEL